MKYVVCFYWEGDRWYSGEVPITGDPSFQKHVERVGSSNVSLVERYIGNLFAGVQEHSNEDLKFVCFTNIDLDLDPVIEIRPIKFASRKGVLPRLYMYSREAGLFGHQVLALDIDVIITGDLTDILAYDGMYCTRASWARGEEGKLDGDIQSFRACEEMEGKFWLPLIEDFQKIEELTTGRERYLVREVMPEADTWQKLLPGQVLSYKKHVMRRGLPPNARIVSCHGFPRPHQINRKTEPWINEKWK